MDPKYSLSLRILIESHFGLNAPAPNRPLCLGAHQDYAIADGLFWYKIPEGGRLVKAAGHGPIFATASKKNHEALRELGVDYCFDYKDEDVVEQIRKAIRDGGERVCFALDAVGAGCFAEGKDFKKSSPAMTAASILDEGEDVHDVKLACVLLVKQDPRYKLCFAARDANSPLLMARVADPEAWQEMQKKVMAWVLENFGNGKYVGCPNITVAKGAEACLEAMQRSAEGKSSFEKIAVEHPL
ncbi:hypothetical protein N0V88_001467 [Collariella sp. IMI 366227]|nr:hypothetical protein N0V88_001467 [Collariella sp. IMI 366227]